MGRNYIINSLRKYLEELFDDNLIGESPSALTEEIEDALQHMMKEKALGPDIITLEAFEALGDFQNRSDNKTSK